MSSPRRNDMEVVIGSCEMRKGLAFRFGNKRAGDWKHGDLAEWDTEVSFAVCASAAYPVFLPALDRTLRFSKAGEEACHRVLLTDGGVYDNLGLQVLEPGRDPAVSLHSFPCEYLIVCNAGRGQESGSALPLSFLPRVGRAFEIVYRRVQDSAMNRLHLMKKSGAIKGFVMPYLGQQDSSLPWCAPDLVPRTSVNDYPTDFAAMSNDWIERLSSRGEQLTRGLVNHYLQELL